MQTFHLILDQLGTAFPIFILETINSYKDNSTSIDFQIKVIILKGVFI